MDEVPWYSLNQYCNFWWSNFICDKGKNNCDFNEGMNSTKVVMVAEKWLKYLEND